MSRKEDMDNRANQMNPNNDAYWTTRGYDERPHDWESRSTGEDERRDQRRGPFVSKKWSEQNGVRIQRLRTNAVS